VSDAAFHAEILGPEDEDPFAYDIETIADISDEQRDR